MSTGQSNSPSTPNDSKLGPGGYSLSKIEILKFFAKNPSWAKYVPAWELSMRIKPENLRGRITAATPWFTYATIDWLSANLRPNFNVFEYGCGGSTLYFAKRARKVMSVELNGTDWWWKPCSMKEYQTRKWF